MFTPHTFLCTFVMGIEFVDPVSLPMHRYILFTNCGYKGRSSATVSCIAKKYFVGSDVCI